jgi:hypothetical protein
VSPEDAARRERARQRAPRMALHKGRLGEPEVDFSPVRGAEAISLLTQLTLEAYGLAGIDVTPLPRNQLSVRFVPRTRS